MWDGISNNYKDEKNIAEQYKNMNKKILKDKKIPFTQA
jgi:hypothetical protein